MQNKIKFTLLVLVLNEIDGLKNIIPKINHDLFNSIIFVDGGSTDGSKEWLREKNYTVIEQINPGLGNAYLDGLKNTNDEYILK